MAAVIRGTVPADLRKTLTDTVERVHELEHERLKNYNGDTTQFDHLQDAFQDCLKKKSRKPEAETQKDETPSNQKPIAIAAALALCAGCAYYLYTNHVENRQWQAVQQALHNEPGILLSHATYENGTYQLHGLADSLAQSPSDIISQHTDSSLKIESHFAPFLSLEPSVVEKRLNASLQPPKTVQLSLTGTELHATGSASAAWAKQLQSSTPLLAGVTHINLDKLLINNN